MKRIVLLGGGLQVVSTILITAVISYLFDKPLNEAVFFGFLFAPSSTAIVMKSYLDRAEIDAPQGRGSVGILLFQDLCLVPMMLLIPILSGKEGSSFINIASKFGTAIAAIAIIIIGARIAMPYALRQIVALRNREVFIIFSVLVVLGTSWVTAQAGLSLAIGAFIAGLVVSESEYSQQVIADILPLRDVFNSIFFVSIGMLLSLKFLASNLIVVGLWFSALIIFKTIITLASARFLGFSLRLSAMIAIGLCQIGEFSFIIAKIGIEQGLLSADDYQKFLATSILSMVATPFLIQASPRIGYSLQSIVTGKPPSESELIETEAKKEGLMGHTIIIGYGLNGQNLSKVLRKVGISYLVLELNPETARTAKAKGEQIFYGDCTQIEVLEHIGLKHAKVLVLAISDPVAGRRAVALAKEMNPHIHIIARTRYMSELPELYKLGAAQVIPEEFETSIEIFSRVLREYGVARNVIQREMEEIRKQGYEMLRAPSLPLVQPSEIAQAVSAGSTETLFISSKSSAVGKSIGEMNLRKKTGATVIAVTRNGKLEINPSPDFRFAAEDIIVLLGSPEAVETAIETMN